MKTKTKMKTVVITLILACSAFIVEGCQKYEEGPMLSLRSKTERVANTWTVDNYKVNETDFTSLVGGYSETYSKDGIFSFNWGIFGATGTWEFKSSNEEILISGIEGQIDRTLYILKLEEKQFWYYYLNGSDKHEFHMIGE